MRYVSISHDGRSTAAVVDGDEFVPLEGIAELGPAADSDRLREAPRGRAVPRAEARLRPLVPAAGRIFCVGLNYTSHVDETKRDLPTYPVLFPKYAASLLPPDGAIVLPPETEQLDYEGELAVVIGRSGRRIAAEHALDHVLGFAVANDVTVRDFQYKTHQWLQGKAWDASTPVGPAVVTVDEFDLDAAGIRTTVNGRTVQDSDLGRLIFSVPTLIETISVFTRLEPGDIILTGTPGGVGFRREPQLFLHDGDTVDVEIDGVGRISNRVVAESTRD